MSILLLQTFTFQGQDTEGRDTYTANSYEFDTDTGQVSVTTSEPLPVPIGDPAPEDYSRPTSERFHYTCLNTTETAYYHNGQGGYTTQTKYNSTSCGFAHPADGTFIRNECNGLNLQQVVHDGSGGERWGGVVTYNATQCGYVAPVLGCTDPTADNYNPNATPGNPDENACTYTPGILSEVKTVEVRSCPGEGVHLQWYNRLGGVDGWYFQGKTDTLNTSEATGEYTYQSGLKSAAGKVLTPAVVVNTSELNRNRFEAICEMFSSPLVWINKPDGTTQQVYVEPASDLGQRSIGQTSYTLQVRVSLQPLNALKN